MARLSARTGGAATTGYHKTARWYGCAPERDVIIEAKDGSRYTLTGLKALNLALERFRMRTYIKGCGHSARRCYEIEGFERS